MVNEVEIHPYLVQNELVTYMKQNNIEAIGYCPLARGDDNSRIENVCECDTVKTYQTKYSKTGA